MTLLYSPLSWLSINQQVWTSAEITAFPVQAFIENTKVDIMPFQVDVRDIGRAHVLAAEVRLPLTFQHRHPVMSVI